MVQEFLPLCDVLFNIISLASYFCDVVFDVVTAYTLYEQNQRQWFIAAISCIALSLIISQLCSIGWYLRDIRRGKQQECHVLLLMGLHIFQGGVLFRYFRLFIPVDLRHVKNDVRDLCIIRLVHAFCEAAPMLLIQLYLIWEKPSFEYLTDLNILSTTFSLFSLCWALASFNKNIRSHNVHRLVLTWLGVIFQLFWRLGTITSRALSLTVYATVYGHWVFLVITLHWVSMFLWLISPKNVFHGEKIPIAKKISFSSLIAFCYVFCYINLQRVNPRQRMFVFYITMGLENALLVFVWVTGLTETPWYKTAVICMIFISFFLGLSFMSLYYRYFHVRRLKQSYRPQEFDRLFSSCTGCKIGECTIKSHRMPYPHILNELSPIGNGISHLSHTKFPTFGLKSLQCQNFYSYSDSLNVPGAFSCRLHRVIKRKKKKPTSFVPLPGPVTVVANNSNGPSIIPFWKRPLPNLHASDHEGSIGSRVNIQQKLQEKKQQQMAELRKIEEEIRAGKLKPPKPTDISELVTLRQPIPRAKKQPWLRPEPVQYSYVVTDPSGSTTRKPRSQTPEILLAPHYLEKSRIYYECQDPRWKYGNNFHLPSDDMSGSSLSKNSAKKKKKRPKNIEKREKLAYKSYRIPSDLDSQISLPRSFTLPREFKYYRRPKSRKTIKMDHFLASTNSSDGDVDSCDESEHRSGFIKSNGVALHPGHHHHHPNYFHYHKGMFSHEDVHETPLRPHPPLPSRIHLAFHRNLSTHETKL